MSFESSTRNAVSVSSLRHVPPKSSTTRCADSTKASAPKLVVYTRSRLTYQPEDPLVGTLPSSWSDRLPNTRSPRIEPCLKRCLGREQDTRREVDSSQGSYWRRRCSTAQSVLRRHPGSSQCSQAQPVLLVQCDNADVGSSGFETTLHEPLRKGHGGNEVEECWVRRPSYLQDDRPPEPSEPSKLSKNER